MGHFNSSKDEVDTRFWRRVSSSRLLTVLMTGVVCVITACSTGAKRGATSASVLPEAAPPKLGMPIDCVPVTAFLSREGSNLVHQGKARANLNAQAAPQFCRLRLAERESAALSPMQLAEKAQMSVGVLGVFTTKGKIGMQNYASGFFVTQSGAFVTCRHCLKDSNAALVVMTRDGRVYPVTGVLAASTNSDVAVLQVDGQGFTPLPVECKAPVGSTVWVLSHPQYQFYSLTTGVVSGYVNWMSGQGSDQTTFMSITADYAVGSSGAPVLDQTGSVVGVASITKTIYGNPGRQPQMALKLCVPSASLLDLVKSE